MPKKRFSGTVVSDKMTSTVVVAVSAVKKHPVYAKKIKNTRKFKARTEKKLAIGDLVTIEECRPYSKTVTWKVIEE
jgi:small subunit ribosomal protein S17